jgi:hypothetical protein
MAHVLNSIRLHQALHGYADGHRLLASSVSLKPRDLKTMLVMSDASGPSAVIGEKGYLTGYPLADSGVYAFACTWAASEMSRPGCVWTHTLLIEFADLAVLSSMNDFEAMFRRPSEKLELGPYEHQVVLRSSSSLPSLTDPTEDTLRRVLWSLYEHPKAKIIASSEDVAAEITLSIWAQQWPRLRRTFRFCTLSFGDRSTEGAIFDLQFLPKRERSVRMRFADSVDVERQEPSNAAWLSDALLDLSQGVAGSLRTFLLEMGGDVTGGREAFAPLCQLYHLLTQVQESPATLDRTIELLESGFDGQTASSLRSLIIRTAVHNLDRVSDGRVVDFLLENIDSLDAEGLNKSSAQIGRLLWSRDPRLLADLLHQPGPRPFVAEQALASMTEDQLIEGARRQPGTIPTILQRRPDLLAEQDLWHIPGAWISEGLTFASHKLQHRDAVLAAVIAANRSDIAGQVAHVFGCAKLLKAIASPKEASLAPDDISRWLAAAVADSSAVAEVLSTNSHIGTTLLAAIARGTDPDSVPNDYGDDPWWTAVSGSSGEADESSKQYLSAYLFARALGYRSRNQTELLEYAFDVVYIPALQSKLSADAWKLLDRKLPNSWLFDWDNCRRMRDAVVEAFVQRDLSVLSFTRITRDDRLFEELAKLAGRTGRGRRFLKRVLQSLKHSSPTSPRISILDGILE